MKGNGITVMHKYILATTQRKLMRHFCDINYFLHNAYIMFNCDKIMT